LQLIGAALALLVAAGVVVGLLPRLNGRDGWLVTFMLFATGLAAVWAWSGATWAAIAAVAVLFGQIGRSFGAPTPGAMRPIDGNESAMQAASAAAQTDSASLAPAGPVTRSQPSSLGRYRIDRALGRGSMGMVYLGHDPQIDRPVAIKTLALAREFEGVELAEARTRFFREAEMAGRLQHADIVTIFDAGEEQELAFIAMEFVNGHDLQAHTLAGRLLPVAVVLHTVARVATALAYAHRQGVVHRDIKPANVMIDAESGTVKVTDFGIARVANASRTRTGMVLGTPSFMSPEQMAGRHVDGRSDLYSLGVTLFQLLTGALPHQTDSMARLMYQIANERAPDVRSLRPDLSETLANVVALALEKRPETRYADGDQLAADLRLVATALPMEPAMAPLARVTPANDAAGFEATRPFSRDDPRHNPGA
jgi:serine/threonine-protein kinase